MYLQWLLFLSTSGFLLELLLCLLCSMSHILPNGVPYTVLELNEYLLNEWVFTYVYGRYRKKLELLFSAVMSWVLPKGSDYHQKALHGSTWRGRCLQGPGMSYHDMPIGLKSEQQNDFVCRAVSVLRTEFREKQLTAAQTPGGIYLCSFLYSIYSICNLAMGIN